MEPTKRPTRDYPSYSGTPWNLWEVMYARRSHRKYLLMRIDTETVASLEGMIRLAFRVRGAVEGSLTAVTEPDGVEEIRRRVYRGLQGKINLWLTRSSPAGFLVLTVPDGDYRADRPRLMPAIAMAAEDCVLWLTEAGLATCWLGGISQRETRKALGLERHTALPAVIAIGGPKPKIKARDMDHMVYRRLSRHRKPLSSIASLESKPHSYAVGELPHTAFQASPVQDIAGLLEKLAEGRPGEDDVPMELAVDACLEAARIAPNGGNLQNWHFTVVMRLDNLEKLQEACGGREGWRAAIVAAGHPGGIEAAMLDKPFWMLDVPIALSHMSIMAASMGCGVDVHIDGYDETEVNELVDLGSGLRTVGVLGIR
ncbi:MAG: nitroreductase family protein [Actinomycetota bacterium]|nr:nitroreductase family protein [Actinomycetota bacterium]